MPPRTKPPANPLDRRSDPQKARSHPLWETAVALTRRLAKAKRRTEAVRAYRREFLATVRLISAQTGVPTVRVMNYLRTDARHD